MNKREYLEANGELRRSETKRTLLFVGLCVVVVIVLFYMFRP